MNNLTKNSVCRCGSVDHIVIEYCSVLMLPQWALQGDSAELEKHSSHLGVRDHANASPLHYASSHGHITTIKLIVQLTGPDELSASDEEGNTSLHWAVQRTQRESCACLLDLGANPNILNRRLMSPLHMAVSLGHNTLIELLLSHSNTDANLEGDLGNTPVMLACCIDNHEALHLLFKYGARLCQQNKLGHYPIHAAAFAGAKKSMQMVLQKGEEVGYSIESHINYVDKSFSTPLHLAVRGGNLEVIKLCIEQGAKMDQQQCDKSTALHFACTQGATEAVKLMLSAHDRVCDVINLTDGTCQTPLHKTTIFDHVELAEYLISKGGDINAIDCKGHTPLLLATSCSAWKTVSLLLTHGANLKIKDKHGCNFLHLAILQPKGLTNLPPEFLKLLDAEDNEGCTPMHYACRLGIPESVKNMLRLNVSLDQKSKQKKSALHFAAEYGRINTCHRLLESMTNTRLLNEGDERGMTPLHLASRGGHVIVVDLLLRKGALFHRYSTSDLDYKGWTSLHLAAREGHVAAVTLLLDRGAQITLNKSDASFLHEAVLNGRKDAAIAVIHNKRLVQYCKIQWILILVTTYSMCCCDALTYMVKFNRIELLTHPGSKYFYEVTNALDWGAAISSLLFVIPLLMDLKDTWHWEAGVVAVLLSWINFLLYFQRFERVGIYVVMFLEIAKTLISIIVLFFFLLLAFALAFYALMLDHVSSIPLVIMQTFVMMAGELNYQENVLKPFLGGILPFPYLTYCIFVMFTFAVPILLINLMIGLAVGDIAEVQANAELKQIGMQIELHTSLEEKMPYWLMKRVDQISLTEYPNRACDGKREMLFAMLGMAHERTTLNLTSHPPTPMEQEISKQKYRLKEMSNIIEKQHNLLKLIVQKMEISSEAEEHDGPQLFQGYRDKPLPCQSKWNPLLRALAARK
uniref:Transient receptor potential cation channel, subfamily A, member 1a n=1 Tax=Oncorhynchus kisutch TaxID=8019 RepID=A0A8C7HRJ6_ONCKI